MSDTVNNTSYLNIIQTKNFMLMNEPERTDQNQYQPIATYTNRYEHTQTHHRIKSNRYMRIYVTSCRIV